jgi:hypothetical protein
VFLKVCYRSFHIHKMQPLFQKFTENWIKGNVCIMKKDNHIGIKAGTPVIMVDETSGVILSREFVLNKDTRLVLFDLNEIDEDLYKVKNYPTTMEVIKLLATMLKQDPDLFKRLLTT